MTGCLPCTDGKNRVSFHYELAAKAMRMQVVPDLFVFHQRYHEWMEAPPTASANAVNALSTASDAASFVGVTRVQRSTGYNWLVGETCWTRFVRRIRKENSGFSMTSEMQQWIDNFIRESSDKRYPVGCDYMPISTLDSSVTHYSPPTAQVRASMLSVPLAPPSPPPTHLTLCSL